MGVQNTELKKLHLNAPMLVAQLDRALDYESKGWKFESFPA